MSYIMFDYQYHNRMYSYKPVLVVFIFIAFLHISFNSAAQSKSQVEELSDTEVESFYERAKSSGMTEMQIEQAAMAQGFTLSDISLMRKRIADIQNKMNGLSNLNQDTLTDKNRKQLGKLSTKAKVPKIKPEEDSLVVFGSDLFGKQGLSFEPNLRIATPKNYQLGPDDELLLEIYGNAKGSYKLKVSPEGTVSINNLAPIYVSGLTVEEAREKIISRMRQLVSGLGINGSFASLNLGNIKSIKVLITGEATKPGVYTVSSLATAFNALYLCGGPNQQGSYRNIKIVRDNKVVRIIDLYNFLVNADQTANIILQDQDIIHIPFYNKRVTVKGELKRPAIYELKDEETLQKLIDIAGGFKELAYKGDLSIARIKDKFKEAITVNQQEYSTFKVESGDEVSVGKIVNRFENIVYLSGAVFRPGGYALSDKVKTLTSLINQANGIREDAFTNRAIIYREKLNLEPEMVAIPLGKILSGELPDIQLKARDSVVIKSVKDLREDYFVTILGEINKPGDFPYAEGMTVSDIVALGNGFTDGAIGSRIEIARRIKDGNNDNSKVNIEIIDLKIDRQLSLNANDAIFTLQPYDIIYIRKSPRYEEQKNVWIVGEVTYPGKYAIRDNAERISQLIERAGGIKQTAYLPNALFMRKGERIALDMTKIIQNPASESNILLQEDDSLFFPKESQIIRITGAVLNPSTVNYSKGANYEHYLSQAGGYGERAQKSKVFITYANGYTQRSRKFLWFNIRPKIEPGSTINVPYKPKDDRKSDLTGPVILSFFGTVVIALATLLR